MAAFEARYGVKFPRDFRDYLLNAGPALENMDEELTNWWPLARLRSIPDEYEHRLTNEALAVRADTYIFFADHLMWSWAWAIDCSETGTSGQIVVIRNNERVVADNFTSFVERHLSDWASLA